MCRLLCHWGQAIENGLATNRMSDSFFTMADRVFFMEIIGVAGMADFFSKHGKSLARTVIMLTTIINMKHPPY